MEFEFSESTASRTFLVVVVGLKLLRTLDFAVFVFCYKTHFSGIFHHRGMLSLLFATYNDYKYIQHQIRLIQQQFAVSKEACIRKEETVVQDVFSVLSI